jgi:hypothetical protein
MKRSIPAMAAFAALAASAGEAKRPSFTYNRAAVAGLTTVELAQRLFGPGLASAATGHVVEPPDSPGGPLTMIRFDVPLRPIGGDLCARDRPKAAFTPIARKGVVPAGDSPSRIAYVAVDTRLAVAPACRMLPGQRFVVPLAGLPFDKSVEVFRSLIAARATAASAAPLPFKLACDDSFSRADDKCGSDPRAVLASLPLNEAFIMDRADEAETFIFQVGDPSGYNNGQPFWEVELKAMGKAEAAVRMAWTPRKVE